MRKRLPGEGLIGERIVLNDRYVIVRLDNIASCWLGRVGWITLSWRQPRFIA